MAGPKRNDKIIQSFIKRQMDFWCSLAGLIILSPLFLIIAILIKLDSRGSVFFVQKRPGKDAKMFPIMKFRTMEQGADRFGLDMNADNPRITMIGKFLRRWHLDEMPQLINVLKGEMSLVGPRPPLLSQVDMASDFEKKRFLVKPGLAGWAQIRGGNWISWKERVNYDVWYVEHWSLALDLKIFAQALWQIVFLGKGLYVNNKKG